MMTIGQALILIVVVGAVALGLLTMIPEPFTVAGVSND